MRNGAKVLVVEDNYLNMKLFQDLLSAHGHKTIACENGVDALDLACQHNPDLIVLDIQIPQLSGLEVARRLKANPQLKNTPIMAVTAFAMKGDEEKIIDAGCDVYMAKPISIDAFMEKIQLLLAA